MSYQYHLKSLDPEDLKSYYKLIKTIENRIKDKGQVFKCEIGLKEVTNSVCRYY
jgi:hypothetical protein